MSPAPNNMKKDTRTLTPFDSPPVPKTSNPTSRNQTTPTQQRNERDSSASSAHEPVDAVTAKMLYEAAIEESDNSLGDEFFDPLQPTKRDPLKIDPAASSDMAAWSRYNMAMASKVESLGQIPKQIESIKDFNTRAEAQVNDKHDELKQMLMRQGDAIADLGSSFYSVFGLVVAIANRLEIDPEEYSNYNLSGTPSLNRAHAQDQLTVSALPSEVKNRLYAASADWVYHEGAEMVKEPLQPDVERWYFDAVKPKLLASEMEAIDCLTPNQMRILYNLALRDVAKLEGGGTPQAPKLSPSGLPKARSFGQRMASGASRTFSKIPRINTPTADSSPSTIRGLFPRHTRTGSTSSIQTIRKKGGHGLFSQESTQTS